MVVVDNNPNIGGIWRVFIGRIIWMSLIRYRKKKAEFHKELIEDLKRKFDIVIFYQRRLKSQKALINICEFGKAADRGGSRW